MGTRGAYGFRKDNVDKVLYNHWDSYWSGLGLKMLEFLATSSLDELNEIADGLTPVSSGGKPTREQIEHYRPYADLNVSSQKIDEWYVLLRRAQGNLLALRGGEMVESEWKTVRGKFDRYETAYTAPPVRHFEDSASFLLDSLFCEYAYIVNLDTQELEFYKGFNKDPNAVGRYASQQDNDTFNKENGYYGVRFAHATPLAWIFRPEADLKEVVALLEALDEKDEAADD